MSGIEYPAPAPALPQVIQGRHYTSSHRELRLADAIYQDCHFDHLTWSECNLTNLRFVNCRFDANRFDRCELTDLVYEDCSLATLKWVECELRDLSFIGGEIRDAMWVGGLIQDTMISKANASDWRFDSVRAAHVSVILSELDGVLLSGGRWSDASCIGTQIGGMTVRSVELENFIVGQSGCNQCTLDACRGINVRWIGSKIKRMTVTDCELTQAAWSHCTWEDGQISSSRLRLASFDNATLINLSIRNADLSQSIFDHASVIDSDMQGLCAPRIAIRGARLLRVQLEGAQLRGLDARGATLDHVGLHGCDCRNGLLIGQPRLAWRAADTRQATFVEASEEDDGPWRHRTQPGARGV
ncbi:pentapeptide repeat-containing protein [Burkholderia sp. BCC0405]|uniref:pentapeptide repeat-containing protein n=1 Tax=Burkholderia sp. BCC0405 TaxID=2676298 RepID=UPI00158A0FBF|nr:pentapeptide repeat-containing protein [Burkholderia sp. BCC0405]